MVVPNFREESDDEWSEEEFSTAEFGDKRLKKRLVKIAASAFKQLLASINQASEDWADAKAAYRFFDNKKVTEKAVLSLHQKRTIERVRSHQIVLKYKYHWNCVGHTTRHCLVATRQHRLARRRRNLLPQAYRRLFPK
jgi:hypothetical protein